MTRGPAAAVAVAATGKTDFPTHLAFRCSLSFGELTAATGEGRGGRYREEVRGLYALLSKSQAGPGKKFLATTYKLFSSLYNDFLMQLQYFL